jgi:hypothetical protein
VAGMTSAAARTNAEKNMRISSNSLKPDDQYTPR